MIPAVGYCRVSGKSQLDGDGFPRQRQAIREFAAAHGFEIVQFFEEKAVPGKTEWEKRPAWTEMLAFLNGTRTIIVERLDRVAREVLIQELISQDLKKRDVTLLTTTGEDTSDEDPTRVMFRQLLALFAQYEKTLLVLKLRAARERKRATGAKCEGARAFGDLPAEEEAVAFMRTTSSAHPDMTLRDLADLMNRRGYPTRFKRRWHANTVARILRRVS